MSVVRREGAARKALWCLGMLGRPHQVRLLLRLIEGNGSFTAPELAGGCGVPVSLVYPFISSLKSKGVVLALPRPAEPPEWTALYGRETLSKKRREIHATGSSPHSVDVDRLRTLVSGCGNHEVLGLLGEASS